MTVGIPSTLVAAETLRQKLGESRAITIKASSGSSPVQSRSIRVRGAVERSGHLFLSSIIWPNHQQSAPTKTPELPDIFTVTIEDNEHSVTLDEIETFTRKAWNRQRAGKAGLSRTYWTRQHRPRLRPLENYTRVNVLLSVNGLILDRSKRRSGRLGVSPLIAIQALQKQFSLV